MDTLLSRLEWVLQSHGVSARQLSMKAGLSHAALSTLMRSLRADPSSAERVEPRTLDRIAQASGIDPVWLKTGAGAPEFNQSLSLGTPADPHVSTNDTGSSARFRNLPNWTALLRAARALTPTTPEWIWERIADSAPVTLSPPTPLSVAEFADFLRRHESPPPTR